MKPVKMWVVCYPLYNGKLWPYMASVEYTRKEAIRHYERDMCELWPAERKRGCRAVRVEVRPC